MTFSIESRRSTRRLTTEAAEMLSPHERSIFNIFVITLIATAVPGKFLFYVSPLLLVVMSLFVRSFLPFWRLAGIWLGIATLSAFTMFIDVERGLHVSWPGLMFGMITYLPIIILLAISKDLGISSAFARRIARVCSVFICIQAVTGVLQFFASGGNGDMVCGTYGLFDFISGVKTSSQVNLTFTVFCMMVYCAAWLPERPMIVAIVVGIVVCAVAQSGHQTIFFMLLIPLLAITGKNAVRNLVAALAIVGVIFSTMIYFYPDTIYYAESWADKVVISDKSLKRNAVENGIEILSDPKNFVFGIGAGQYSSRAALIVSGSGTTTAIPSALIDTSTYFDNYMQPLVDLFGDEGEGSAMAMPYFSALGLFTEFGVVGAVVFLIIVIGSFAQNVRMGRANERAFRKAFYCNFFIGFMALCCFIQYYLENIQGIMIPILLYAISRSRLRSLSRGEAEPAPAALAPARSARI